MELERVFELWFFMAFFVFSGTGSMVERSLGVGETPGSIPGSPMFYLINSRKSDLRGIAQLAERLVRDQEVLSSNLSAPNF